MSTQKPVLLAALEITEALVVELRQLSDAYNDLRQLYVAIAAGDIPEGVELSVVAPPGVSYSLPWPEDAQALQGVVEQVMPSIQLRASQLGGQVTECWAKLKSVVDQADLHCSEARRRGEQQVAAADGA